jgi:hypothetical protein
VANLRIKAFDVVSDLLIWVAFLCGIIGAFAMAATPIGARIGDAFGILPAYFLLPAALLGLAMVLFDIKDDGIPNRLRTMYIAVLWPSALLGVDGPLAGFANGWIHGLSNKIYDKVAPAISDSPTHSKSTTIMATIAVTGIVFALYTAHRYYASHRGHRPTPAAAATTGTGTSNGTANVPNRKRR